MSVQNLIPKIEFDFNKIEEVNKKGEFTHPETLWTYEQMSRMLPPKWNAEAVESLLDMMSSFSVLPIQCKGKKCRYAHTCVLVKADLTERFEGKECPIEFYEAFKHLRGYLFDLDLSPGDYTDVQILDTIINCHLNLTRIDKQMKVRDMYGDVVSGVDMKTGLKHQQSSLNVLFNLQKQLRLEIQTYYKSLLASRSEKLRVSQIQQQENSVGKQFSDIVERAMQLKDKMEGNRMDYLEMKDGKAS